MLRPILVIVLLAAAISTARAQGAGWDDQPHHRFRHRDHRGAHVRFGGNYELLQDSTSGGPIVIIGGDARINGHADDDVVVIGGNTEIGPTAVIDGDLVMLGGHTHVDPAAKIYGDVSRGHMAWPDVNLHWPQLGDWWSRTFAFGATLVRLGVLLFGGLLLTLVAPRWLATVSQRVNDMPGLSAVIGFATEMFLGPALVVIAIALVISIVGIPLLAGIPVLLVGLAVVWVTGFTAAAARVGAAVRGEQRLWRAPRVGDFVLGFLVLTAVTIAGRALALGPSWMTPVASAVTSAGLFIEYCAWTLGLGAAVGALFAGHHASQPPPIPPLPTPAS